MTSTTYRLSWVTSANDHRDFPLQNLPFGIFSPEGLPPRGGVAIGDFIFDLQTAVENSLFTGEALSAAQAASGKSLNAFFSLPSSARLALRERLLELLDADYAQLKNLQAQGESLLRPASVCKMHLPAKIGDYTDFYTGIHHAVNVGRLFRPDNPLLPNYKYVPIG
ncbi:MAG: fumarylacetoacetase, partial [Burkholderiales bacterium]|nr:fumarylacetoacetase [Burkholderiales bacterium]